MNKQDDLIDGLSVGVLAGKTKSPVMLVGNSLDYNQKELFKTMRFKSVTQIGGNGNEKAFSEVENLVKQIRRQQLELVVTFFFYTFSL